MNGTISINDISAEIKNPRIDIDLGANNIITGIEGYKINNKEYIVMTDNKGNLSHWGMSVEDKFNYITAITKD